jgi:hypothetical protein
MIALKGVDVMSTLIFRLKTTVYRAVGRISEMEGANF